MDDASKMAEYDTYKQERDDRGVADRTGAIRLLDALSIQLDVFFGSVRKQLGVVLERAVSTCDDEARRLDAIDDGWDDVFALGDMDGLPPGASPSVDAVARMYAIIRGAERDATSAYAVAMKNVNRLETAALAALRATRSGLAHVDGLYIETSVVRAAIAETKRKCKQYCLDAKNELALLSKRVTVFFRGAG